MEQYWYGVLDHDGVPRRRFYEIKKTGHELQKLEKYIVGSNHNLPCKMNTSDFHNYSFVRDVLYHVPIHCRTTSQAMHHTYFLSRQYIFQGKL